MKHLVIAVDDMRDLKADILCRTYKGASELANAMCFKDMELLLDHDLGESKTGYDFIKELLLTKNLPWQVFIVSSNPVGRDNIGGALMVDDLYIRKSPHQFVRK